MAADTLLVLPIACGGGLVMGTQAKVSVRVGGVEGSVVLSRGDMIAKDSWQPDKGTWDLDDWVTLPLSRWLGWLSPELQLEAQSAIFSAVVEYLDDAQARAR